MGGFFFWYANRMKFTGRDGCAVGLIAAALLYAAVKPIWDWDVIPYLFLAKQALGFGVVEAHGWVYAQVQALPEVWKLDLLDREEFRQTLAADPEALRQVSRFYAERVGYYGLLAGLMGLGIPAFWAVQGLGMVALAGIGTLVWVWAKRIFPGWGALVFLATVLAFPSVMKVVRWSNPDALVALCYLLGVFLWLRRVEERRSRGAEGDWWVLAWLAMVVLRPNAALWLAPLGLGMLLRREWNTAYGLALVGVVAGALHHIFPPYGAMVSWRHAFERAIPYPAVAEAPFEMTYYLHWLRERMLDLHGRDLLLFMLMWVCLGLIGWRESRDNVRLAGLLAAGVLLHVLAFPGFWERLYVGPVLVMVLLATPCAVRGICGKAYLIGKQET